MPPKKEKKTNKKEQKSKNTRVKLTIYDLKISLDILMKIMYLQTALVLIVHS